MVSIITNTIALFHGAFLLFLLAAVLLSLAGKLKKYRKLEALLLIGITITILSFVLTGECFLTTWERQLREAAGQSYGDGFIATYIAKVGIHISGKTSFWILTILITTGILSEIYWNKKGIAEFFNRIKF